MIAMTISNKIIELDGTETGSQFLRTALCLSVATGRPFHLINFHGRRTRTGFARKHLTAVRAAECAGRATITGAELNSTELEFHPAPTSRQPTGSQTIHCPVGLAGHTGLVALMLIPALMNRTTATTITLDGITHGTNSPSYEFLETSYLPLLRKIGCAASITMERPGFSPAGGGRIRITVEPSGTLTPIFLCRRGELQIASATAVIGGGLSDDIARRELKTIQRELSLSDDKLHIRVWKDCISPGNALILCMSLGDCTEAFTEIGELGKSAEKLAQNIARQVNLLRDSRGTVSHYLAEHLLLPMAITGGGSFITPVLTAHTRQTLSLIPRFLPVMFRTEHLDEHSILVELQPA